MSEFTPVNERVVSLRLPSWGQVSHCCFGLRAKWQSGMPGLLGVTGRAQGYKKTSPHPDVEHCSQVSTASCHTCTDFTLHELLFVIRVPHLCPNDAADMNTTAIPKFPSRSPDPLSKALTKNLVVVLLGVSITCIGASFLHAFSKHQTLYLNPRYILFIHLVLNDMIHVMLTVILFVISYTLYKINFSICCIIILIIRFATENTPLNVACMAIECYIAVCLPLRHSGICTIKKTFILIGLIWVTSLSVVLPDLFVTLAMQPLDFFHSQFACNMEIVFPSPVLIKKKYIIHSLFLVIVWFTIFYTYFRILFTARAASKDSKKARNTIILHGFQVLLCMTTYVGPHLLDVVQRWFLLNYLDSLFAFYIIVHVLPRSISPIIYGVRDETFRKYLKKNMLCFWADYSEACKLLMTLSSSHASLLILFQITSVLSSHY
ncbi:odorant receptor 131-2-like [Antennarius striatus]|uniref:odorant receptor 131-2-like n=1 Tax=Antennarius striatus TaxID=241820 RepID=UPI0035AF7B06